MLYTDGVTDAPGELAVTDKDLAYAILGAGPGAAAIANAIDYLVDTRRPGGATDDTALLLVEIEPHRAATTSRPEIESSPPPF